MEILRLSRNLVAPRMHLLLILELKLAEVKPW